MAAVGVFGKLPQRGDFIAHRLPASFSDPWHAWLSAGLAESRNALEQRFVEVFLQAPVWRFALQPGRCGPAAATGILMPSVDAAERLFPLCLAAMLEGEADLLSLLRAKSFFDALEDHARLALESSTALDDWLEATERLIPPPGSERLAQHRWTPLPEEEWPAAMGDALSQRGGQNVCMFWSDGSPFVRPSFYLGDSLPNEADFARLLADPPDGSSVETAA